MGIPHDRVTYAVLFSMAASLSPIYSDLGHAVKIFIDVWSTSNAIVLQRTIQDVLLGEEIAQIPNLPKV